MGLTSQPFLVIFFAFAAVAVSELLSWLLVYRTNSYRRLSEELDRSSKKLEAIKQSAPGAGGGAAKSSGKKEKRLEELVKTTSRDLSSTRMKLNFITGIVMVLTYNVVSTAFDGVVVARLPFHPPSLIANITHRGLLGDDVTECSAAFICTLSIMFWKFNVAKFFGFAPSRAAARLAAPAAMNMDKYK